jgi:hypothetical protein
MDNIKSLKIQRVEKFLTKSDTEIHYFSQYRLCLNPYENVLCLVSNITQKILLMKQLRVKKNIE